MSRLALAVALALALVGALAAPVRAAAPEVVVVVLDRSASLRHADPTARGPRALAMALALAAREGQRVALLTTDGVEVGPVVVDGADPAALLGRLDAALSAGPRNAGGADLGVVIARAHALAGPRGLVVLYTDDDLDVVGADGRAPAAALERARAQAPRPARDDVNRAAADLLAQALPERRAPLVGLRAELPVRTVPVLERLGAAVIELRPGASDAEVVARLAAAVAGEPVLLRAEAPLTLPWPARVGVLAATPVDVPGGVRLDGGGRLWLLDAGPGALPVVPGASAVLAPRVELPAALHAWGLAGGVVRVTAEEPAPPPGGALAARLAGAADAGAPFVAAGDGLWHVDLWAPDGAAEVEVLRVVAHAGGRATTARRRVAVTPADVVLVPRGPAQASSPLELRGALPPGFVPRRATALRVHEAGGASRVVPLEVRGREVVARVVPQRAGALDVTAEGELPLRLAAPIDVGPEVDRSLVLEAITAAWDGRPAAPLAPGQVIDVTRGDVRLELTLRLEPPSGAPLPLAAVLEGAARGSQLVVPEGATILDRATLPLELRWPRALGDAAVTLRVRAGDEGELAAGRALALDAGPSWTRRGVAAAIIVGALVWFVVLVRRRRRLIAAAEATMGERQLRAVGDNGRLTFERYRLLDHSQEDLSSVILPEDSNASIELTVRDDGSVHARALDGAQIVHEDRPTVLGDEAVLRHGTAFAVVHEHKARRYVYLDREPSAEELTERFVDAVSIGEGEVRDSGVFVLLDDDQNLASTDAVPATTRLLGGLPAGGPEDSAPLDDDSPDPDVLIEDSAELPPARHVSGRLYSDEGIVIMDSTEASIMDSDEVDTLPDEETVH